MTVSKRSVENDNHENILEGSGWGATFLIDSMWITFFLL